MYHILCLDRLYQLPICVNHVFYLDCVPIKERNLTKAMLTMSFLEHAVCGNVQLLFPPSASLETWYATTKSLKVHCRVFVNDHRCVTVFCILRTALIQCYLKYILVLATTKSALQPQTIKMDVATTMSPIGLWALILKPRV